MLRCVRPFVRVTTVPHFRFMIRSGRFLPPSLAVWLCSAGLQIAPITLQRSCQEHQRSWTAFVINNRQGSCDNMTNACLHIVALLRCIPAGPGSGLRSSAMLMGGFPQHLHENTGKVSQIRSLPFRSLFTSPCPA